MPRLRHVVLVLLCSVACDPGSAPPTAPNEPITAEPATIELEDWTSPTLELVDPGSEPRAALRVPVATPGPSVLVQWETAFETTAKRGVTTTAPSTIRQKRLLRIAPTAGTPAATVDFTVLEATERARGGPPPDDTLEQELVGRQGRWQATERCQITRAGIDKSNAKAATPHLPGLLRTAAESCPLLPEEAVGVGARWTTKETTTSGESRTTEWVLTTLSDDQAAVTFQSREGSDTLAEGRVGLDRRHLIPTRFDATGRTVRTRPDPSSPERSIQWTTTWEMHAERKADPASP